MPTILEITQTKSDIMKKFVYQESEHTLLRLAKTVLITESEAVRDLAETIDSSFLIAIDKIVNCKGKVIVTGLGKSGIVGKKISATLSSTGTPSLFMHASEANHGDLGVVESQDLLLAISNSGEGVELLTLAPLVKRQKIPIISITSDPGSSLAKISDVHLNATFKKEACPLGLAPTTSSTVALALGDALALVSLKAKGFQANDFARSHPSGKLGRQLSILVDDVMRKGDLVPLISPSNNIQDAIIEMTEKGMGMTLIAQNNQVVGIFTDGDLRRFLQRANKPLTGKISEVMTESPQTIGRYTLAIDAAQMMEQHLINQLIVVDEESENIVGAINMHDLLQAKVI